MSCLVSDPNCVSYPTIVPLLQQFIVCSVAESFAYGCFVVVALQTIYFLLRGGFPSSMPRRCNLVVVLLIIIHTTLFFSLDLIQAIANIALGPFNTNANAAQLIERTFVLSIVLIRVNYILTDAVVVWRAWVIVESRAVFIRLLLVVCLLGTTVCVFLDAVSVIKLGVFSASTAVQTSRVVLPAALLTTNAFSTMVILYKTWMYQIQIKMHLNAANNTVERVLILLNESGFVYISVWSLAICTVAIKSCPAILVQLVNVVLPYTTGTYPLLVILIIEHRKSLRNAAMQDTFSLPIHFVSRQHPESRSAETAVSSIEIIRTRDTLTRLPKPPL